MVPQKAVHACQESIVTMGRLMETEISDMAEVLRTLAHETRLRLIDTLLADGEKSVGEMESLTGVGQPALSQQLGILRKAELVNTRREAKQIYYSIRPEAFAMVARYLSLLSAAGKPVPESGSQPSRMPAGAAAMFARILKN